MKSTRMPFRVVAMLAWAVLAGCGKPDPRLTDAALQKFVHQPVATLSNQLGMRSRLDISTPLQEFEWQEVAA